MSEALKKLQELIEAAKEGAIIPVRLPGQLEEIERLMMSEAAAAPTPISGGGAPQGDGDDGDKPSYDQADADDAVFDAAHAKFMSVAIHELRTPMTSIRGYSDMLNQPAMGELNDMQTQFLGTIRTNARRMEGLLQDVNDITKVRAEALKLNAKMDMFKNIAMMVEKSGKPIAEELNKTLTLDIPDGLPILTTDGEMLAKALGKFVENALRYSPDEGAEVVVKAYGEGSNLIVDVIDKGVGMTPEEIAKLGTLYYRADNDYVRTFKGSGLGVPIALGIIEALGGSVVFESTPNEGTTVKVTLPGMA